MGNCLGGQGRAKIDALERAEQNALSQAFTDAQVVVPWTSELNLLSVLIQEPRSKVGYMRVGSLAGFVTGGKKKEELTQLTASVRLRAGEPAGQKVVKNVSVTRSELAELFFGSEAIHAEAKLGAFMDANASLQLSIEQHYLTLLNDQELDNALDVQLDTSPNSAALRRLKGWEKGEVVIYVVDKIYQTTRITLASDKKQAVGVEGSVGVEDLHTEAGLRIRKDKGEATLFHIESTKNDADGNPVPFSIAFKCWELRFNGQGKIIDTGFTKLPFRAAGASTVEESIGAPSLEERRPRLGNKTGGIVVLMKEVCFSHSLFLCDSMFCSHMAQCIFVEQRMLFPWEPGQ